ncbi:TetR family transcriptional regulator [Streptosporangium amethystogenes subsp. fukuiense]|uniref:TetR family transcriptional regulator n=1 Tax=Streptosporangium amethystogenes subsp. fukuiense TaxID=698418 RepID=A0ABW2TC63_9ACTN
MSEPRRRMSGKERREQLIQISRTLFAEKGFDGTSVEEIAATANVSKPVVYEHFGGKEGVYAVVIDREMQKLLIMVTEALSASHSLIKLERAALALLAYVEENSEGFRILVRDSHAASGTGTFASLINDIASQVEDVMVDEFVERGYDPKLAPMYAQMLVGMVALTGQWWLDVRRPSREEVAAHLVNLAWNGLTGLDPSPRLTASSRGLGQRLVQAHQRPADADHHPPGSRPQPHPAASRSPAPQPPTPLTEKELRELEKAREREQKEQEKLREREQREAEKLAREQEKARLREQRELEKAREREQREQQRLLREQERAREREQKELEKAMLREAKAAEREAVKRAKLVGEEQEKLEPSE